MPEPRAAASESFAPTRAPWRARDTFLLAIVGLPHVALLAFAARQALSGRFDLYEPQMFVRVGLVTLIVSGGVLARWPRHAVGAVCALCAIVALALMPLPVLAVAVWLLSAHVVGRALLRALRTDPTDAPVVLPMLVGVVPWIGVIAATASLKMHFAPVYAVATLLILVVGRRTLVDGIATAINAMGRPESSAPLVTRAWLALLTVVIVLHLFIAARPEVGFDANTVHLQLPLIMQNAHRFAFDVERMVWAVMPLGPDWAFTAVFMLGGETAARLLNLAFGAMACALVYALIRVRSSRADALAVITLIASTPLAFLESGSLFVDTLWLAYLLAVLLVVLRHPRDGSAAVLSLVVLLAAGAMQSKVLAVVWLAPVLLAWLIGCRGRVHGWKAATVVCLASGLLIGAWPYANAWLRTGNPVFPFLNGWFRSAQFYTGDFFNELYRAPLEPWSLHAMIVHSESYIEGRDGAAGFVWLLLVPLVVVGLTRWRRAAPFAVFALAVFFFMVVFRQQSYLRYLVPALALLAVLGGWALAELPQRRTVAWLVLAVGVVVGALQVRLIYAGSWTNATLCASCSFDPQARERYIATYMPDRLVGQTLDRVVPQNARVGFVMPNAPTPAGYVGYSRQANWHDFPAFDGIMRADNSDAIMEVVRKFRLTHAVCRDPATAEDTAAVRAFCSERVTPIWRAHGRVVGEIRARE